MGKFANVLANLFVIFFSFFYSCTTRAYETDYIKKDDNIETIAKRNFNKVSLKYGGNFQDYEEDIKKWNPKITNWKNPPVNQYIYVDYPYAHYVLDSTWSPSLGVWEDSKFSLKNASLSGFFSPTFGRYTEKTANQTVISNQNFPLTFGLGFSFTSDEKKHYLVGSGYWAQPSKGNVSGDNGIQTTSFTSPGEIGSTLYYQYYFNEQQLGLYTGYDYEKLNTFNTNEIVEGVPLKNIENNMHYATVGLSKAFSYRSLDMNLKASVSNVISSSTTGTQPLKGYKYILYFTYKPTLPLSLNFFYKHHSLSGPTDLSIDRIGLSLGITIF